MIGDSRGEVRRESGRVYVCGWCIRDVLHVAVGHGNKGV